MKNSEKTSIGNIGFYSYLAKKDEKGCCLSKFYNCKFAMIFLITFSFFMSSLYDYLTTFDDMRITFSWLKLTSYIAFTVSTSAIFWGHVTALYLYLLGFFMPGKRTGLYPFYERF